MSTANEVALGEKWSTANSSNHQWTHLNENDFSYIDEDEQHNHCPRIQQQQTQSQDNESQLRNRKAMSVDSNQKQLSVSNHLNLNCSGGLNATGNCANPMRTPAQANHGNEIGLTNEYNNTNGNGNGNVSDGGGGSSGTVTKPIHHSNDSETYQKQQQLQQQQQIQRLSNNISNNNKIERNINGGRLNGCCCPRRRRLPSSSEECVDDDQADNYSQRSKNNNNNIKMTITLTTTTTTTTTQSPSSVRKRNECGPLPMTTAIVESLGTPALPATPSSTTATATTTAMTALTTATTTNAIEMASAPPMTTSATAIATTTRTTAIAPASSSSSSSPKTMKSTQRVMIGCGPNDNSNESGDGNRTKCEGSSTQRELADSSCNDTDTNDRKCNDECNNDNTMTRSAINTPSMQSSSLSSSPVSSSSSSTTSSAPPATEAVIAATSQATTTSLLLPSQPTAATDIALPTSAAAATSAVTPAAVSSSSSSSSSTGHEVLTKSGNKYRIKATATGGNDSNELIGRNTSNSSSKPAHSTNSVVAACNVVADDGDTNMTRNTNHSGKDRVFPSQRRYNDSKAKCDKKSSCNDVKCNLNYITMDELDDSEDPYFVLQAYLERVKNEINEVFEQYKAKQNDDDELTRCPDADTVNVIVADNKLPFNATPCRLNGIKVAKNETNNSSDDQSDINGSTRVASNSGRYLTVPVPSAVDDALPTECKSAPATPAIMSANTFPSLNHGNAQTEQPNTTNSNRRASTLKRLNSQSDYSQRTPVRSPCSLEYLHGSDSSDDVNIWANKFLRELDNLMGSDKWSAASTSTTATNNFTNGVPPIKISIPRPEKHVTIPLQSFNLDCRRIEIPATAAKHLSPNSGSGIIYLRTLSAPNGNDSNNSLGNCRLFPKNTPGSTVLKIEENDATIQDRRRRQFESDMETMRTTTTLLSQALAGPTPTPPKRERFHQAAAVAANSNGSYLLHNDTTKKGSTSTIWTSEESILRSFIAADEDNNSSSSSACEEASGVLSSGKSGISLDSSGLDNDNNESGIGTATPPKEVGFWKSTADNDSLTSSLDALRKIKFQKGSSMASSDDPDLLEVLSLYDETHDEDVDDMGIHHDDEHDHDHGHEEFETGTFDGYDSIDCENTSNGKGVVLRKKSNLQINDSHSGSKDSAIHLLPYSRAQKCRSHSLEVSLPLLLPQPFRHELRAKEYRDKGRLCLALRQEPFQSILPTNFHELPSPSSASLHSGHESLGMQELTTKSNSAPLLLKKEQKRDDFGGQKQTLRYSRSQSDRYLAEIEAVEACKWLRAAGFPQYAQMYEDHQFPIDLTNVAKDHTNLENDPLQSLYRRLCILNRCANMRLDSSHKTHTPQKEDSDDENCALSENWTFQPHIRRWSRIGEMGLELPTQLMQDKTESSSKESSPDRFDDDDTYDISGAALNLSLPHEQSDGLVQNESDSSAVRLRRTGSERLKDGAKALLRRVESIKSRRRKRQNREGIVISGPQALDLSQLGQRHVRKPDAVYSTPPSPSAVSPMHMYPKSPLFHHPGRHELKVPSQSENFLSPNRMSSPKKTPTTPRSMRTSPLHFFATPPMPHLKEGRSDDSSSYYSDSQESSSTGGGKLTLSLRKAPSKSRRFLQRTGKVDDIGTHSDSECHQGRKFVFKDANSSTTEMKVKKLTRGGSLNLGKDPKKREGFRSASFRTRSTVRKDHKNSESDTENIKVSKSPVVRWHSFQEEERPHMIFKKCFSRKVEVEKTEGTPFAAMSCGQLQIIRKLALAILTGYMERYCPTHRSGWNWELPKFIKKIKMPDYKDKKVFGVPLLLILQRTGQTLPMAVRAAFRWLQLNALDQIGLFRKSGVKSRIFKLKERIEFAESSSECMDVFDTQQAYDVADMLKQYFRDLPESLLTNKMSETFAAIFQHLPPDVRLDAVQCAVLLLPDENREILYALLEFLTLVADNSQYNQMTANNLAVCLAPSLFHNSLSTGSSSVSASPRRRKTTGVPDVKELSEAKASHECLAFMIDNYMQIFTASRERISKCNFGYMEESKPVPLDALGDGMQFHNWRGYLYECTSATIKEGREKSRGWFTITSLDSNVDIAYKKVGDGHPLRLWRCITEVEGPPKDVLDYVLKQRATWDINLLQSQTIKKLDERTEIFQYVFDGQMCTDFCVLRSWQTDLPRGACVIVETSIDHPKAKPIFGSVRGVVLASRYLIEPCGSGRSRVMHLARVDIKGKTPEWYNKSYGHICSHYLSKIKMAFRHVADGPESKV